MSDFVPTFKMKDLFFDKKPIIDKIGKARVRVLSKQGAFVRKAARSSIRIKKPLKGPKLSNNPKVRAQQIATQRARQAKRIGAPGQPPFAHSPEPNLRTILFAYDARTNTMVVGPVHLNGHAGRVPALMEKGGTATVFNRKTKQPVTAQYRPHPFMRPALERESKRFPELWKDMVK